MFDASVVYEGHGCTFVIFHVVDVSFVGGEAGVKEISKADGGPCDIGDNNSMYVSRGLKDNNLFGCQYVCFFRNALKINNIVFKNKIKASGHACCF